MMFTSSSLKFDNGTGHREVEPYQRVNIEINKFQTEFALVLNKSITILRDITFSILGSVALITDNSMRIYFTS